MLAGQGGDWSASLKGLQFLRENSAPYGGGTMPTKRYAAEQIIGLLRQDEVKLSPLG